MRVLLFYLSHTILLLFFFAHFQTVFCQFIQQPCWCSQGFTTFSGVTDFFSFLQRPIRLAKTVVVLIFRTLLDRLFLY